MQHGHGKAAMRAFAASARGRAQRIGFVPTMGALHEGHLSLVDAAASQCETAVVSIFVNPTQFGPNEDLDKYPRDLDGDLAKLEARGAAAVFTIDAEEMYQRGFQTWVEPGPLAEPLCGASRPGHFRGVTTVVTKLFHLLGPDRAYLGQKDFQQARVLQQMVDDLDFPIDVRIEPTVREVDGLACSSRNLLLTEAERAVAPGLQRSLRRLRDRFDDGERDAAALVEHATTALNEMNGFRVDYIEIRDDETLTLNATLGAGAVAAAASYAGATRLLDNVLLGTAAQRLDPEAELTR